MKLILCKVCHDVVKGAYKARDCACGASGLQYIDELNAIYWGKAVPLGFNNSSLVKAIGKQPKSGQGKVFEAFVIPKKCDTFVYRDKS